MASKRPEWSQFGWQGLRVRVPEDWNLGRVDGDGDKGYARLDDAEIVRLEVEWRRLGERQRGLRLPELVNRYLAGLEKKAQKAGTPFAVERQARFLKNKKWLEGAEYEVFIWEADFRAYNLARLFADTGRVVLLRVLAKFEEDLAGPVEEIFRSLADGPVEGGVLWSVYGVSFLMPEDFKLAGHELKSGHIQLSFEKGKHTCRVHRLSMARILLKGASVQEWYPVFFKKSLRDLEVEIAPEPVRGHQGLRIRGRPRSRWRQLLRPLPFLNPRPRLYMDSRIWHLQDRDKICLVEHLYRKKDEGGDLVERVVDGYFFQEQGTQTQSGRHAGVAAGAQ